MFCKFALLTSAYELRVTMTIHPRNEVRVLISADPKRIPSEESLASEREVEKCAVYIMRTVSEAPQARCVLSHTFCENLFQNWGAGVIVLSPSVSTLR